MKKVIEKQLTLTLTLTKTKNDVQEFLSAVLIGVYDDDTYIKSKTERIII